MRMYNNLNKLRAQRNFRLSAIPSGRNNPWKSGARCETQRGKSDAVGDT